MNGIVNFFKPKGMTSHQAVNFLRKKLDMKKIGHTGTLDPEVSGVLPLCVGKATRVSEYLLESDKEYIGELTLGIKTSTGDSQGEVIETSDKEVSQSEIEAVFKKYLGEIEQIPPMHSALKHKGQKLYDLARAGIEVERKPRRITVYENEILDIIDNKKILFRIKCSKGTYIRTICEDIGEDLGTLGYMSYLIRTESDIFKIEDAIGKETIENMSLEDFEKAMYSIDTGALKFEKIEIADKYFNELCHGIKIDISDYDMEMEVDYRIYCKNIFIGVASPIYLDDKKLLKMKKVLMV